jgi:integrase
MNLMQRSNSPFWWYDFTIEDQRYRGSTKRLIKEKAAAERFVSQLHQEKLNQNQFGFLPEITLTAALARTVARYSGRTLDLYDTYQRKMVGGALKKVHNTKVVNFFHFSPTMNLSQFKQKHIDDLIAGRKAEGHSANSIGSELRFLRLVINQNSKDYSGPKNKLDFSSEKGFVKSRYITDAEEVAILALLNNLSEAERPTKVDAIDLLGFLISTGLRVSEAMTLQWSDVNMTEATIEVYRSKTKIVSVVPMSPRVMEMMARRHNSPEPIGSIPGARRTLRVAIEAACNSNLRTNAQRGKATVHSLRDTFATRLLKRGMTLHELSKLLGHTTSAMSAKYAYLEQNDVVNKARLLMTAHS